LSAEPRSTDFRRTAGAGDQLQLVRIGPTSVRPKHGEQLSLLGEPIAIRVPALLRRSWLDAPGVAARLEEERYTRGDQQCWPWLAAVSSTGHGS
jgi:hypothetical protein